MAQEIITEVQRRHPAANYQGLHVHRSDKSPFAKRIIATQEALSGNHLDSIERKLLKMELAYWKFREVLAGFREAPVSKGRGIYVPSKPTPAGVEFLARQKGQVNGHGKLPFSPDQYQTVIPERTHANGNGHDLSPAQHSPRVRRATLVGAEKGG